MLQSFTDKEGDRKPDLLSWLSILAMASNSTWEIYINKDKSIPFKTEEVYNCSTPLAQYILCVILFLLRKTERWYEGEIIFLNRQLFLSENVFIAWFRCNKPRLQSGVPTANSKTLFFVKEFMDIKAGVMAGKKTKKEPLQIFVFHKQHVCLYIHRREEHQIGGWHWQAKIRRHTSLLLLCCWYFCGETDGKLSAYCCFISGGKRNTAEFFRCETLYSTCNKTGFIATAVM